MIGIKECDCEVFQSCDLCSNNLSKVGPKKKKVKTTKRVKVRTIEPPTDRKCVNCKRTTETECYHHAESKVLKFLKGGGIMGSKIPDLLSAWLCDSISCGQKFDTVPSREDTETVKLEHDLFSCVQVIKTHLL